MRNNDRYVDCVHVVSQQISAQRLDTSNKMRVLKMQTWGTWMQNRTSKFVLKDVVYVVRLENDHVACYANLPAP